MLLDRQRPTREHGSPLVLGVAVGILIGVAGVLLVGAVFDGDDDAPTATAGEVEHVAASLDRIQRHCRRLPGRHPRPSKTERKSARRALAQLLVEYRRQPEKTYRLDDSSDPVALDASLDDLVFSTFDGPCPEIARGAKEALLRTP